MGQGKQRDPLSRGPLLSSIQPRPSRRRRRTYSKAFMRTVMVSNDLVRLSFLAAVLRDAGIESILLDHHVSTIEGSIGAIPRRLAVLPEDESLAHRVLAEAGEASVA